MQKRSYFNLLSPEPIPVPGIRNFLAPKPRGIATSF